MNPVLRSRSRTISSRVRDVDGGAIGGERGGLVRDRIRDVFRRGMNPVGFVGGRSEFDGIRLEPSSTWSQRP